MSTLGFFTPYVEARAIYPASPGPQASGSNTSAIDQFRQGVEIATENQRYNGTLPKLDTDDRNHQLELVVFGQSNEFSNATLFGEVNLFDSAAHIQNSDASTALAVFDSPAFENSENASAILQPLSIPARNFLRNNFRFDVHTVKCHLMDGNENSFGKVDHISNVVAVCEQRQTAGLFVDLITGIGIQSGSTSINSSISNIEKTIEPFDESKYLSRTYVSGTLTGSFDVIGCLLSMSADTDQYVVNRARLSCTGFAYENSDFGVDSIAFGGFKRA